MVNRRSLLALIILMGCLVTQVFADNKKSEGYYSDRKTGYWWYQDPQKEEKKEKKEEKKEKQEKEKDKKRSLPSLKDFTYEQLWNMHPDDFQSLLMDFQKKAVMTLKPEDVYEYYVVQDLARRKSLAFANLASYTIQRHPELDVGKDYPIVFPGRNAYIRMMDDERKAVIASSRDDFGLLYFYSPTCPYCKEQDEILRFFVNKYNWEMKKVNIETNPSLSARFGIATVPALVLIYKYSADYLPVSAGVVSLIEVEEGIYRGIKFLKGEISPEEWSMYGFQKGSTLDPGSQDLKKKIKN